MQLSEINFSVSLHRLRIYTASPISPFFSEKWKHINKILNLLLDLVIMYQNSSWRKWMSISSTMIGYVVVIPNWKRFMMIRTTDRPFTDNTIENVKK
jgi:hypothetical protein